MSKEIYYSDKYEDDKYEYRHVMLPKVRIINWFEFLLIKTVFSRLLRSWCLRRTACPSKSGGTWVCSKALGKNIFFHFTSTLLFMSMSVSLLLL